MADLFVMPARGQFDAVNALACATLIRSLEYVSSAYRNAWRSYTRCSALFTAQTVEGWPPPYTVAVHGDGVIVAFAGCQNYGQFLRLYQNSHLENCFRCPGQVFGLAAQVNQAIRADIISKIDAAPNRNRIIVTGHSFGGVLAAILAEQVKRTYNNGALTYCMTFGSPKPGDGTFAAAADHRSFSCANHDDKVVNFPYWTARHRTSLNLPTGYALPDWYGQQVIIQQTLPPVFDAFTDGWQTPTLVADYLGNLGATPTDHALKTYCDNLMSGLNRTSRSDDLIGDLRHLNRAMTDGFDPVLPADPVPPPVTTPVATPPAPTVAQAQKIQTVADLLLTPPAPVYNTAFVGAGNQAIVTARIGAAPAAGQSFVFKGDDWEKIRNARVSLEAMFLRDAEAALSRRTTRVSNRVPFIDGEIRPLANAYFHLINHLRDLEARVEE